MQLKGKTVLITGGASGIGLEAAKQFIVNGASVIITGRNQVKLDEAKHLYPSITAIKSDVSDAGDAQKLFNQVKQFGGIDILYNNAGVLTEPANLGMANNQHFEDAAYEINVNYLGVIRLNNLFMEMLKSRNESAIINTTSILSYVPSLLEATYSASKVSILYKNIEKAPANPEQQRKNLRTFTSSGCNRNDCWQERQKNDDRRPCESPYCRPQKRSVYHSRR
jgi:uncharacterized oxidoreductase